MEEEGEQWKKKESNGRRRAMEGYTIQRFKEEGEQWKVIPFKDLPLNKVYQIIDFRNVLVNKKDAMILKLEESDHRILATSFIIKTTREKKAVWEDKKLYNKLSKNPNRTSYYDFKVIHK